MTVGLLSVGDRFHTMLTKKTGEVVENPSLHFPGAVLVKLDNKLINLHPEIRVDVTSYIR